MKGIYRWIVVITVWMLDKLNYLTSCLLFKLLEDEQKLGGGEKLHPLTPLILKEEEVKEYESGLLDVLKGRSGKRTTNIAISGGYAVGKSSFIRTFLYRNKQYRNSPVVSMAKFCNATLGNNDEIEKQILEQLLYSKSAKKLNFSKYKRIREPSKLSSVFLTILFVVFVFSSMSLYKNHWAYFDNINLSFINRAINFVPAWLDFLVVFLFSLYAFYRLIIVVHSFKISKISAKGAEIESQTQKLSLQENIDELLYYFEKYDGYPNVVIFEDIDRLDVCNAVSILTHIRQINHIVNNSISKPTYFIYAIKDELFNASERVKFFDLIIPIVPVINSNNAFSKLISIFGLNVNSNADVDDRQNTIKREDDISIDLVRDCSYYFSDMRMIYSLSNEYKIYSSLLFKEHNLDRNKLFSLLVVKTLYPDLFGQLVLTSGKIYNVLDSIGLAKKELKEKFEERKKELFIEWKTAKSLIVNQSAEILSIYWSLCFGSSGDLASGLYDESSRIKNFQSQMLEGSYFESLLINGESKDINYYVNGGRQWGDINFGVKNYLGLTYNEYIELLHRKDADYYNREIDKVDDEISKINIKRLKELLALPDARKIVLKEMWDDNIDDFKREYDLLEMLMSKGYLAEDFYEYTSFFYTGAISKDDKNKILKIKKLIKLPVTTSFDNPMEVFNQLDSYDLSDGRGLIIEIIPLVITSESKSRDVFRGAERFISDVAEVFTSAKIKLSSKVLLMQKLKEYSPIAIIGIIDELSGAASSYKEAELVSYLHLILASLTKSELTALPEHDKFFEAFSSVESLYQLSHKEMSWLLGCDEVNFWRLSTVDREMADSIIKSRRFTISMPMLTTLINSIDRGVDEPFSYKRLLDVNNSEFLAAVNESINDVIYVLVREYDNSNGHETKDSIIKILKVEGVNKESGKLIGLCSPSKFLFLDLNENFQLEFFESDLINPSWNQLEIFFIRYENRKEFRHLLVDFVEKNINLLLESKHSSGKYTLDFIFYLYISKISLDVFDIILEVFPPILPVISSLTGENSIGVEYWERIAIADKIEDSKDIFELLESQCMEAAFIYIEHKWPKRKHWLADSECLTEKLFDFLASPIIPIYDKFEFEQCLYAVDFSSHSHIASDIVMQAIENSISLPPLRSSLVSQSLSGLNEPTKLKLALYYLETTVHGFSNVCDMFDQLELEGLRNLRSERRLICISTDNVNEYLDVLHALGRLNFIGSIDEDDGVIKAYVKYSNCHD